MRPSWIEIDLAAIAHNVSQLADAVAPAELCVVVKADAYGHGDVPVAEVALQAGATRLGVALMAEGIRLREAGIEAPILMLSEPAVDDAATISGWRLTPTVYHEEFLRTYEGVAPGGSPVHIKVDTGMHRVGAQPEIALELARRVDAGPLHLEGLWTHFAVSESDDRYTALQASRLRELLAILKSEGIEPETVHAGNSAVAISLPDVHLDIVRTGIAVYGLSPGSGLDFETSLRPAMRVVSRVSHVTRLPAGARPSYGRVRPLPDEAFVATVPIGYADGVTRRLGEAGGEVLIGGKRRQFAGRVTMDQIVIDCGDDAVNIGDEVVLIGRQGDEEITADEWARLLDTINYEVVCGFGPRLPRRYS